MEEWRQVPGFPDYEISSLGRLKSYKPYRRGAPVPAGGNILKPALRADGYLRTILTAPSGRQVQICIHTLVLLAWHGPRPPGNVGRHLDGVRTNNTPGNLAWGTHRENVDDAMRHGTVTKGEAVHTAKLSESQVLAVRASRASNHELAGRYGVTPGNISAIRSRKTWKHLP